MKSPENKYFHTQWLSKDEVIFWKYIKFVLLFSKSILNLFSLLLFEVIFSRFQFLGYK